VAVFRVVVPPGDAAADGDPHELRGETEAVVPGHRDGGRLDGFGGGDAERLRGRPDVVRGFVVGSGFAVGSGFVVPGARGPDVPLQTAGEECGDCGAGEDGPTRAGGVPRSVTGPSCGHTLTPPR